MINLRQTLEGLELKDDAGRHITARPEIVDLALRIADLYASECLRTVGRHQRFTSDNAKHLYKAALLCNDLEETPEVFVATQMRGMLSSGQLWLSSLSSPRVHNNSKAFIGDVTLDAVAYYKAQLALFNDRSRLYGPTLAVEDLSNEFSPLFRWVLAHDLGLTDLASALLEDARNELLSNPIARDVFGNCTDPLFRDSDRYAHHVASGTCDAIGGNSGAGVPGH